MTLCKLKNEMSHKLRIDFQILLLINLVRWIEFFCSNVRDYKIFKKPIKLNMPLMDKPNEPLMASIFIMVQKTFLFRNTKFDDRNYFLLVLFLLLYSIKTKNKLS